MGLSFLFFWSGLDDQFVSQNPREFYVSHSLGRILFCAYTIYGIYTIYTVWSDFDLLHNSQWIRFSTQLCTIL